ncbi:uncharacterized protein [Erythrolamprus reginae]|uniref:uncharacterized protein n=1 Tax=Erythrolamprus reginae TaxID=121349 RepID=UPI00396C6D39
MKPFLFLIPAAVAAASVWPLQETEVNAGNEIKIPCDLKCVQLLWYWIPRYPICAGLKLAQIKIYSVISNKTRNDDTLKRFQRMIIKKHNGKFVLTVPLQHMNDSGTFYCSDGNRNASFISVVVKSDNQHGMTIDHHEKDNKGRKQIKLTCNSCGGNTEDNMKDKTHKTSTIAWTLNGKEISNDVIRKVRTIIIVEHLPRYYGLWKCSNARCPTQSDGYCLEDESRISEGSKMEEMLCSTPTPPDTDKKFMIQVIAGCVIGIIAFLCIGVTIFVLREKLRSRRTSPSKTASKPKSQVIQNSVGIEKPSKDEEKDVEMNEGAEGIHYSVLQLKEPERCQSQEEGTPAIIYSEMLASDCSKS